MNKALIIQEQLHPYSFKQLKGLYLNAKQYLNQSAWEHAASFFYYLQIKLPQLASCFYDGAVSQMNFGFYEGARLGFEHYLILNPWDADTICNLGIIYWKEKKLKKALSYFKFNLKHHPNHFETHLNLASLYYSYPKHLYMAIQHYHFVLTQKPELNDIRFNLASCLQKKGLHLEAIQHYQSILKIYPKHYPSLYNLGCIHWRMQNQKKASFFWQEALKIAPNQKDLRFMFEYFIENKMDLSKHQDYVENLFNHYADYYETHLLNELAYQLPHFLKQYTKPFNFQRALEIGCGTGLCGKNLKSSCQNLIGIDISEQMLKKAREQNIYDHLFKESYEAFLAPEKTNFNLIAAFDVTPYIANMELFLKLCQHRLATKGRLWLTIELNNLEDITLEPSGRFSYSKGLIEKLAFQNGLKIIYTKNLLARLQEGRECELLFMDFVVA